MPGLLLALAACRSEVGGAVPPFARGLPGHTLAVVWPRPDEAGSGEWLADLRRGLAERRIEVVEGPGHVALLALDPEPTGYATLAESPHFQEACARVVRPGRSICVYVDLQADLTRFVARRAPAASASRPGPASELALDRLRAALHLEGLRYLAASGHASAERGELEGVLATSGSRSGLPGLLTPGRAPASLLPEDAQASLALEASFDRRVAEGMLVAASGQDTGNGWLANLLPTGPVLLAKGLLNRLDGRVSAQWRGDGRTRLALGLVVETPLDQSLEPLLRRFHASLHSRRLLLSVPHAELPAPLPERGAGGPLAPSLRLRFQPPQGRAWNLDIDRARAEDDELTLRVVW